MSAATDRKSRLLRIAPIATVLALASGVSFGQDGTLQLHGYFKNLGLASSSVFEDRLRFLDITRLRLKGIAIVSHNVRSELWLDTEVLAGSFLESAEFDIGRDLERRDWVDLDWRLASASNFVMEQRVFRAYVTAAGGPITATVGRQRVAWGTSFAWNPTDLLNPFNPAAIELGEKAGIDGVHVAVATGDFSRLEIAYAQGDRKAESSLAARSSTKLAEYDASLMAGYFRDDWVIGGDFAGYVGDAGLRGEIAYTVADSRSNYLRFTLTADRSFAGVYYAFVEYYFNGQGTSDKSRYDFRDILEGRSFNVARNYLAATVTRSITPLLTGSLYLLANIDDRSALFGPSIGYSLSENVEFGASVYLFGGVEDTEFGSRSHAYFAFLQAFF